MSRREHYAGLDKRVGTWHNHETRILSQIDLRRGKSGAPKAIRAIGAINPTASSDTTAPSIDLPLTGLAEEGPASS